MLKAQLVEVTSGGRQCLTAMKALKKYKSDELLAVLREVAVSRIRHPNILIPEELFVTAHYMYVPSCLLISLLWGHVRFVPAFSPPVQWLVLSLCWLSFPLHLTSLPSATVMCNGLGCRRTRWSSGACLVAPVASLNLSMWCGAWFRYDRLLVHVSCCR